MGILGLGKKSVVVEEAVEELPQEPPAFGPSIAVLEPDVAGISSFRLRQFRRAGHAEDFVATLRPDARRGTHAFWAMHEQPEERDDIYVEALVLVRTRPGSDVVYIVSFLDIESAESFTRFEVRRGLALENVLIYWAAFVQFREELEGVTIVPGEAPRPAASTVVADPPTAVERQAEATVDGYLERSTVSPEPPVTSEREIPTPEMPEPGQIQHEDRAPEIAEQQQATDPEEAVLDQAYVLRHEPADGITEPPAEAEQPIAHTQSVVETEEPSAPEEAVLDQAYVLPHEPADGITEPPAEAEQPMTEPQSVVETEEPSAPEEAALDQAYVLRHEPVDGIPEPPVEAELEQHPAALDANPATARDLAPPMPEPGTFFDQSAVDPRNQPIAELDTRGVVPVAELPAYPEPATIGVESPDTVADVPSPAEPTPEPAAPISTEIQQPDPLPPVAPPEELAISRSLRQEGADAGMLVDDSTPPSGPVVSYASEEELAERSHLKPEIISVPQLDTAPVREPVRAAPTPVEDRRPSEATGQGPDPEAAPAFDIEGEVARLLKNRRWDKSDNPFSGFKSPPGRF